MTVAVTGTTVIMESRGGRNKLIVLEGGARLSLVKYPKQFQNLRGAQMVDVPSGATTVPLPVNVDLNDLMRKHPLITGFPPLPSRDLILAASEQEPPPSGPSAFPIVPVINLLGGVIGGPRGPRNPPGRHPTPSPTPRGHGTGQGPQGDGDGPNNTTPTPTPRIYRQPPGQTRVPPATTTNRQNVPKPKPTPIKKKTNQPSGPR